MKMVQEHGSTCGHSRMLEQAPQLTNRQICGYFFAFKPTVYCSVIHELRAAGPT